MTGIGMIGTGISMISPPIGAAPGTGREDMIPGIATIPGTAMTAMFSAITGPCSGATINTAGSADHIGRITAIIGTVTIPGMVIIGRTGIIAMDGTATAMTHANDSILTGAAPFPTDDKMKEHAMNGWTIRAADPTAILHVFAMDRECKIKTDMKLAVKEGSGSNRSEAMCRAAECAPRILLENHASRILTPGVSSAEQRIGRIKDQS